jgi:hypothetical protein
MTTRSSPLKKNAPMLWFFLLLALIAAVTFLGPKERTLGSSVRIVYLHGAWVWTALIFLLGAGIAGAIALVKNHDSLHAWSTSFGRTGVFFWVTYLPISLAAMQANWNGLFLAEPRWRVALVFGLGGAAIQIVLALLRLPALDSLANLVYVAGLFFVLARTDQVMHPSSPIFSSDSASIQAYFIVLTGLVLLAAWQMVRWWQRNAVR